MTGKIALPVVAQGVYAALNANATLMNSLTGGVLDHPLDPKLAPGVVLSGWTEKGEDTSGVQVRKLEFDVNIFSAYEGLAEALTIAGLVAATLHRGTLTLTGWTHDATFCTSTDQLDPIDIEGRDLQHVVSHYTIDVTEVP